MDGRTVGVLGGGQLGRMMAEAGHRLGIRLAIVDPGGSLSPAGQIAELSIEGSFQDAEKIKELAAISDVLTVEIEHVNADILEELEKKGHIVEPSPKTIRIIQDKYQQKLHLRDNSIPLPDFIDTPSLEAGYEAGALFGYPFMLKNKRLAYDGRGNAVVSSKDTLEECFARLGGKELYAEKWVPFSKELAVMVARTQSGCVAYPLVETIQSDNICHIVLCPPPGVSSAVASKAMDIASRAIATFPGLGIYGVELFLSDDNDTILLNEIAPRPHNSGHYTMEACDIDQFEMHLRAVLSLPCPTPTLVAGAAVMVNIIGKSDSMEETQAPMKRAMGVPGTGIHWYGKAESRKGRKMAHMTVVGDDMEQVRQRLVAIGLEPAGFGLLPPPPAANSPRVGIIMGSDSDLPTMMEAAVVLDSFGVPYELTVVSAHRTPTRMYSYAQSAADRGIQVIIAGAGGAAHLPGMVAALTPLPVVGVPVKTSTLNGQDSLLSIVQMPKGIPVATVAIGNAANAGLLAVRILAASQPSLLKQMVEYMARQEEEVLQKAARLESIGYQAYLGKS